MLEERDLRDAVVVRLAGEIDLSSVGEISAPLFAVLARTDGGVVRVDCSEVAFIESQGLAMMVQAQRFADEHGTSLVWMNPPKRMLEVIHLVGMSDVLTISITSP